MPEEPFVVIGDVHGRADLLPKIEALILRDTPGLPAVMVGDYIDRGESSRDVLELLLDTSETGEQPVICLLGNHEEMCLKFLDNPEKNGERWLRYGGLQTLASFGIGPVGNTGDPARLRDLRDNLAQAMGDKMIEWLRARPLSWKSGNVWVVHAGADPMRPMEDQSRGSLLWGHEDFSRVARPDGIWVAHGHTIIDSPRTENGRIPVDTGAYATGRLTAAIIAEGDVKFLSTG